MSSPSGARKCHVQKIESEEFQFYLIEDKSRGGQVITSVTKDGPAYRGGLKNGDRIISINGKNVQSKSHNKIVSIIRKCEPTNEITFSLIDSEKDPNTPKPKPQKTSSNSVGHSIRHVTKGGAADQASLRAGDRLIAVGKTNVEKEKHAQVVYLIKQAGREVTLLVIDEEGYKELKAKKVPITENLAKSGSVKPKQSTIEPSASKTKQSEMKPRLCHVVRRDGGFGFFLKDDKGHYLINLEKNGPAFRAGALNNDRIVEVNGVNVENEPHSVVVKMIHPSNEVTFLVVGKLEDKYFRDNGIAITSDLLNTPDENQKHMPTDQEESQSQSRTVEFQETTTEGKPTCVICLTNAVNVYFRPCGHVCCCRDCHGQLTTCPMCRKPIVEKLFAFL